MSKKRKLSTKKRTCHHCSYYKGGYCDDLDCQVNPNEPMCSDDY